MKETILVVDDDSMNLSIAKLILQRASYDVIAVDSGEDCLDTLAEHRVDLILLDIKMPGMDGIETLQEIRSNLKFAKLPVIFLTAKADINSVKQARQLVAADYLVKPYRPEDLLTRVRLALSPD